MIVKCIVNIESIDEVTGETTTDSIDIVDAVIAALQKKKDEKGKKNKSKLLEDPVPKLILNDGKFILTTTAIEMLGVEPGKSKLDVQYQRINGTEYPVIAEADVFGGGGNKLALKGTVKLTGVKYDELSEYGDEFILVKHPNADRIFVLTTDGEEIKPNPVLTKIKQEEKPVNKTSIGLEQPEKETTTDFSELASLLSDDEPFTSDDFNL